MEYLKFNKLNQWDQKISILDKIKCKLFNMVNNWHQNRKSVMFKLEFTMKMKDKFKDKAKELILVVSRMPNPKH